MPPGKHSSRADLARAAWLGRAAFLALGVAAAVVGVATLRTLRVAGTLKEQVVAELGPVHAQIHAVDPDLARAHDAAVERSRAQVDARVHEAAQALLAAAAIALALALAAFTVARRSLRALALGEERYGLTFEAAAIGIAHVGLDGRWLRVNRRYVEMLGYEEEELRALRFQDVTHPDDLASNEALARRLLTGEAGPYALEKRYLRRDGRATWVNLTVALARDERGRPSHFIAAAQPMDERKAVEQELRETLRARDEFLQIASHELRTPLTSLRLQLEGLRRASERGIAASDRLAARLDAALRQQTRLSRLVDELLDFSRISRGELRIAARSEDLARVVRGVVDRLSAAAAQVGTEVRLSVEEPLPARFDPEQIDRATANVLANALKYGAGKPVDVELSRREDIALLVVRDRGIGVEPAERERIFERFARAVSSRHYGGLGLGLFVARRVVEAHGGRISVEGAAGAGATFRIELPLAGPASGRQGAEERPASMTG